MDQPYEHTASNINKLIGLHQAVAAGNIPSVQHLLMHELDISVHDLATTLELAKTHNQTAMCKFLSDIAYKHFQNAAVFNDLDILQDLMEKISLDPAAHDSNILRLAIAHGSLEVVKWLMNSPQIKRITDKCLMFRLAVEKNQLSIVKFFLEELHVNPVLDNHFGLSLALCKKNRAIAEYLWNESASQDPYAPYGLIFEKAVKNGYIRMVDDLLAIDGINLDKPRAFKLAAKHGQLFIIKKLILNVSAQDINTAYCLAAANNHLVILTCLEGFAGVIPVKKAAFCLAANKGALNVVMNLRHEMQSEWENAFKATNLVYMLKELLGFMLEDFLKRTTFLQHMDYKTIYQKFIHSQNIADIISQKFIQAAKLNCKSIIEHLLSNVDKKTKTEALVYAAENGNEKIVRLLLHDKTIDVEADRNLALRKAASNGYHFIVNLLIQVGHVNPANHDNYPLRWAAKHNQLRALDLFLQRADIDPCAKNHAALCWSAKLGHITILQRLLEDERIDPGARENFAIRTAAARGYINMVICLLEDNRVDASAKNCQAIHWARAKGHKEVERVLLKNCKVKNIFCSRSMFFIPKLESIKESEDIEEFTEEDSSDNIVNVNVN